MLEKYDLGSAMRPSPCDNVGAAKAKSVGELLDECWLVMLFARVSSVVLVLSKEYMGVGLKSAILLGTAASEWRCAKGSNFSNSVGVSSASVMMIVGNICS